MNETITKENKKIIISLTIVSFFLAFNYFILKSLKESLLVTAPEAGAEAIPFVKMWLLFPISLIFLMGFTWMASRISFRTAVVSLIAFLLSCYALFAFVLYPIRESIHLYQFSERLEVILPEGWRGFAAVVKYWSYSLFYVVAECWCTLVYSVVFWGYANAVIKFTDARKYYPYLTLAGTLSAILAGPITIYLTSELFLWQTSFYSLISIVIASGCFALILFFKNCPEVKAKDFAEKKKPFWSSLGSLFRSKYLLAIAAFTIAYNMLINLTDVVWKNQVLLLHDDPASFTAYLSYVTVLTGLVSTGITLLVTRRSLKHWGWTKTALITPLIALSTGLLFFAALFVMPLSLSFVTFLGSLHILLSSSAKYTLFEPTKEMAYIPLSHEEKLHGKAAIDGVGQRLGKTLSSATFQILLIALPTISACTPFVAVLLVGTCFCCISGIIYLGKEIESKTLSQQLN